MFPACRAATIAADAAAAAELILQSLNPRSVDWQNGIDGRDSSIQTIFLAAHCRQSCTCFSGSQNDFDAVAMETDRSRADRRYRVTEAACGRFCRLKTE